MSYHQVGYHKIDVDWKSTKHEENFWEERGRLPSGAHVHAPLCRATLLLVISVQKYVANMSRPTSIDVFSNLMGEEE